MEIPKNRYSAELHCNLGCQKVIPKPYIDVQFDRDGTVYIVGYCPRCKVKVVCPYPMLGIIDAAQQRDGFKPTLN